MATNLAKAYVQIVPSAEGMKGMIEQAMGKDPEEAGEKAGNSIASKIKEYYCCCWNWKSCISGFYQKVVL